ncbi:amidohydrolase [Paracoccus denitrificans]|jgi:hippurate hydrolase|uniref:Amidohydrolase n=1 Tax=Paracoccus denitrificans (strain Pd 1222) TaxID=318586 RepID=A1AYF8_PARDP|nr:amidohydrolase [Paracoccus denitrificans]ABL68302.1 amidohydrolase [Paracoccus denitrificans PD1222]MBB4627816.1 hippurate hydrolase [Paracoccus denitrificans]MCU7428648.1 amidohydrolase [Paracoccus denitrificans]QAR26392.1 amidohydrolase [Paracoccus denitrificans]UPV95320.1 amidohydrolase [Paracoccus denitrificans]
MGMIEDIVAQQAEFIGWRHALHENPGIGFQETFAAELVEAKLREFGLDEVHPGIGGTGVVGVLRGRRQSNRAIGLRADMDALPIHEETGKPYASKVPGVMHACGHDGHTATLLATAWHLSRDRDFAGTVHFIFQPAEEGLGGALAMIRDGLLERFPCDRIYAYHNFPGIERGHICTRPGRMMAGCSFFTIRLQGRGGHAALPQTTVDAAQMASNIVVTAQSIVARNLDPNETGIISFTDVYAGTNSHNVIPDKAELKGCLRYFDKGVGALMKQRLEEVAKGVSATYGGHAEIAFDDNFVPLVNDPQATVIALSVAAETVGAENVRGNVAPFTGSEDFAYMTEQVPGSYVLVGAGPGAMPHNPGFDFNDEILATAASYFCRLVRAELA